MGNSILVKFARYVQTARYLRFQQWLWRPYLRIRRQLYLRSSKLRGIWKRQAIAIAKSTTRRIPGPFLESIEMATTNYLHHLKTAENTEKLQFKFLNHEAKFQEKINWSCPDLSQLWRYNLHYQDYATSLGIAYRITGRPQNYATFKHIILDWIAANPLPRGDGWHPYVASLRVVNWILALHLFSEPLSKDHDFSGQLLRSLIEQILYIAKNMELDVGGNHLIANIKVLCLAGTYFSGRIAEKWLRQGLEILNRELDRQVLLDGGHFERSPMYHAIVLEDLLMIAAALKNAGVPWPTAMQDSLIRMARFLEGILHPDGEIALFNDSAFGVATDPESLLVFVDAVLGTQSVRFRKLGAKHALFAESQSNEATPNGIMRRANGFVMFPETGYFVLRKDNNVFLIDAGPVCPDDLPAHAHADIFTFELSIRGKRWIVDSGVREYAAGAWRDYARSTRAHNTVVVSGMNQVDVWSSFRVGRRVKPKDVFHNWENGTAVLTGRHEGYGRYRTHTRVIVDLDSEVWIFIDEVGGTGQAQVQNFIHLHPDVSIELTGDGAILTRDHDVVRLLVAGPVDIDQVMGKLQPLNGWYMPEFGLSVPNPTIVIRTDSLPSLTSYVLSTRSDIRAIQLKAVGSKRRCVLCMGLEEVDICWDTQEPRPAMRRKRL